MESCDLVYNYACVLLYSGDCVPLLLQLLDRVLEEHSQPSLHTATLVGTRGSLILAVLRPAVAILRRLLGRNIGFQVGILATFR